MKFFSFLLVLLFSVSLFASEITEPKTGVAFPDRMTIEQTELILAGVGVRTKFVVKVYAGAMYVEQAVKNDLEKYKDRLAKPDQTVYDAIIQSPVAKLFVLHFVRDVEGSRIMDGFREGLEKGIDLKAAAVRNDAETFLKSSVVDVKKGEVLKVYVKGDEIRIFKPGGSTEVIKNAKLAPAVAGIWLGRKPPTEDLKKGMISRLAEVL